jgi:hypothetical protein
MSDPVTLAALEAGRRALQRRLLMLLAWSMPLILIAGLTAVLYATVLMSGGVDHASESAGGVCGGLASPATAPVDSLDAEQLVNVQTIAAVGRQLGVPAKGLVIAVATAMQESTLHNIPYGDRDSLGLFQQRESWGSRAERLDPAISAEMFFVGGRGGQSGLLAIPDYLSMSVTVAAQAVQRSAFPDAYAKWEPLAIRVLGLPEVASATCAGGGAGQGSSAILDAAMKWLGTPYSWGGGSLTGPSLGIGRGANTVGFDCSGLTRHAVYVATGRLIPRGATDQGHFLTPVARTEIQAGDLLFFQSPSDPPGVYHHVGIADGEGGMLHAPRTGSYVKVEASILTNPYWSGELARIGRA